MAPATAILAAPGLRTSLELPTFSALSTSPDDRIPPRLQSAANPQVLVLTDDLAAEIARENERLETASPQEILAWATSRFAPRFPMATAFGPEGMVLSH